MTALSSLITPERFDAVLFDLDGVLTATAAMHAACWKEMFDEFLQRYSRTRSEPFRPFDEETDYRSYVDGKPRLEGVRSFLESRAIDLPEGEPPDPPGHDTVWGLGNHKNELVHAAIAAGLVDAYPTSIELVRRLEERRIKTAVVSSSRNCQAVLRSVGIEDLFLVVVDGRLAEERMLRGKPAPDTFLEAATMLGIAPARGVVVEDAIVGVQAGRAGGFGLVIGVDRDGIADALRDQGADVVVSDLAELLD